MIKFWKILKIILVVLGIAVVITLGIMFIPGFFSQNKTSVPASAQSSVKVANLLGLDKMVTSAHFTIYFTGSDEKNAQTLINICENDYLSLAKFFPALPMTEILITENTDTYLNIFNAGPPWGGADRYKDPNTSAGSFCPGCTKSLGQNTEYIYMLRPQNRSFAHELSHRYYWTNYPNLRYNNDLIWLNEGLAVFIQDQAAKGPGGLTANASKITKTDVPASLSDLNALQQKGNPETFYDLVGLLATYINTKSTDGLKGFISDLNKNKNLDQTCLNKLGFGADQLLIKWRETLQGGQNGRS